MIRTLMITLSGVRVSGHNGCLSIGTLGRSSNYMRAERAEVSSPKIEDVDLRAEPCPG